MLESYTVGSRFVIVDEATPVLRALRGEFTELNKLISGTKTQLQELLPPGLGRRMLGLSEGIAAVAGSVDKMTGSFAKAPGTVNASIDEVIAAAKRGGDGMLATSKEMSGAFANIFADATKASTDASNVMVANVGRITAAISESNAALNALTARQAEINGSGMLGLPGSGGGGGPRHPRPSQNSSASHGGGDDLHFSRQSVPIPGAGHVSIGGNAALAAAGVVGYAAYEAAEVDDVIARAMITGQLPVGQGFADSAAAKQMRELIQDGMSKTGFSAHEVGEAILGTERQFGGLQFSDRMQVLQKLLPYAGADARLKEATLPEAFESMVAVSHMTGTYDPAKLPEMMRAFSFASMITPTSLPQFRNALGYSLPELKSGLGMDPETVMFLTAMMQTAGITNTKSGTWLRNFFQKSEPDMPTLGPLTKEQKQHNEALRALGMIDAEGKVTWQERGADGQIDWLKSVTDLSAHLGERLAQIPTADRLEIMHKAWGTQGEGFGSLQELPQFVEQLPILAERMKAFRGGDDVLGMYSNSPAQKVRETWRDTQNILMDIGEKTLPAVNYMLQGFDDILRRISDYAGTDKKFLDSKAGKQFSHNARGWDDWLLGGHSLFDWLTGQTPAKITEDRATRARSDYIPLKDAKQLGLIPSFDGLPAGFHKTAFTSDDGPSYGGASSGTAIFEDCVYHGTYRALMQAIYGKDADSGGGAGSGAGGFINASYTIDGDGGSDVGGYIPQARGPRGGTPGAHNIRYGHGGYTPAGGSLVDGPIAKFVAGKAFATKAPEVMSRLMKDFGLSPEQAAIVLGNLGHESSGFSAFHEKGLPWEKGGLGWAQWTGPRRRQFEAWAAANHLDPRSDEANYGFLKHELGGSYHRAIDALKHGASLEQFEKIFEGAGVKAYGSRHHYEALALHAYKTAHDASIAKGIAAQKSFPTAGPPPPPTKPASRGVSGTHGEPGMISAMANIPPIILEHHSHTHLDGRKIAKSVTRHQVDMASISTSNGGMDPRAMYAGGAVPQTDAV